MRQQLDDWTGLQTQDLCIDKAEVALPGYLVLSAAQACRVETGNMIWPSQNAFLLDQVLFCKSLPEVDYHVHIKTWF